MAMSDIPDTDDRKTRRGSRRTQTIAKRYVFHANTHKKVDTVFFLGYNSWYYYTHQAL